MRISFVFAGALLYFGSCWIGEKHGMQTGICFAIVATCALSAITRSSDAR